MDRCTHDSVVLGRYAENIYNAWKERAERLEGLNVAHYRADRGTARLHRFVGDLGELDGQLRGRWRAGGRGTAGGTGQ